MFPVLIPLRQRIALCFHALSDGIIRWMNPCSTSLLLGTIADLVKGKSELLVENALLRQQLIILRRNPAENLQPVLGQTLGDRRCRGVRQDRQRERTPFARPDRLFARRG